MLLNPTDKNDQSLQVYVKRGKGLIVFLEQVFFNSQKLFGVSVEILSEKD